MNDESDLFIASSLESLSDFLKTDIANNKRAHCTFDRRDYDADPILQNLVEQRNIRKITFTNPALFRNARNGVIYLCKEA